MKHHVELRVKITAEGDYHTSYLASLAERWISEAFENQDNFDLADGVEITRLGATIARPLRPSEVRHLSDIAEGLTAQESATRHGVSMHTVTSYLREVKMLLGARNITHAVALWLAGVTGGGEGAS